MPIRRRRTTGEIPMNASREERLEYAAGGRFVSGMQTNPETGRTEFVRGSFRNPGRIAFQQPETAGNVGPYYRERLEELEAGGGRVPGALGTIPAAGMPSDSITQQPDSPEVQAYRRQWQRQEEARRFAGQYPGAGYSYGEITPKLTPQQQVQNWGDVNTAVNAEIVPKGGKSTIAPKFNMFQGSGSYLDSALYFSGRTEENKEQWDSYELQFKAMAPKIDETFARRGMPKTMQEAQEFMEAIPGLDGRLAEFASQYVTRRIFEARPELGKQIVGEQKVREENQKSFMEYQAQNPGVTEQDWTADTDAPKFEYDAISGAPVVKAPSKGEIKRHEERQIRKTAAESNNQLLAKQTAGGLKLVERAEEEEKAETKRQTIRDRRWKAAQQSLVLTPELLADLKLTPEQAAERNKRDRDIIAKITEAELAETAEAAGGQPAAAPVMTPEEAATAAPGTFYKTNDGRTMQVPLAPAVSVIKEGAPLRGAGTMTMGGKTVNFPEVKPPEVYQAPPLTAEQKEVGKKILDDFRLKEKKQ